MKRAQLFLVLSLILLLVAGIALSQSSEESEEEEEREISFEIEAEIGRALPRSLIYDPNFERLAVVDAYNRLSLVDALTYETETLLYERGGYNDIAFSNDGRWFALAIEQRIELYDANTGALVADLTDLSGALQVVGPLAFSPDDTLLKFEGVYPAPRSIRLFEGQTLNVPWVWNLPAARNEAETTFRNDVEAWQFFDYRNGFAIGPDNRIVAALPGRLQVLDGNTVEVLFDIPTARYEQDPLSVSFSFEDDQIYVRPVERSSTLLQVDTQEGVLVEIPLNTWLTESDLELVGGIELGQQARIIGESNSRRANDLLRVFLGQDYTTFGTYAFRPLTVTLVDLIIPPAATEENISALLFIYDERREEGRFIIASAFNIQQMTLNPDGERLLIRRSIDGEEFVVTYNLNTGEEIDRYIPALRAIGSYSRTRRNRILAYDRSGEVIVSDFQRLDADTGEVVAEDLRYARSFDRFFFTQDNANVVTLSDTEWRLWSIETGEVIRREVLPLRGSIISTSSDGFRFLTRYGEDGVTGVEVVDLNDDSRRSVNFARVPGSTVEQIYPDEDWERFFITYSPNAFGQYFPGNQVGMYSLDEGQLWFIAGDDLPPTESRQYGWVDDDTVYVIGSGVPEAQPARVYGVDYALNGLPLCIVEAFPEQVDRYVSLWERLVVRLRPDTLANLSQLICSDLPADAAEVEQLILPTNTPVPVTLTPIVIPDVPICLTARYPDNAQEYAAIWFEITEGLPPEQIAETEDLLCDGIDPVRFFTERPESIDLTMMIDAQTGERASGSFTSIPRRNRPIAPVQEEYFRTEERDLGQAVLSPNEELVAASSLPGELIIYRLVKPYQELIDQITATAVEALATRNLIGVLPSPTPTFNIIGTPRPTLTPTTTPTSIPRPEELVNQPQLGEVIDFCPAEQLTPVENAPEGYSPIGQLIAPVSGDSVWSINPQTGRRGPDETVPQCDDLPCQFSPDKAWILVVTDVDTYVIRPDGTEGRTLFSTDEETREEFNLDPPPPFIFWSGRNTLEYEVTVTIMVDNREVEVPALQRDILGVFPDPEPWIPEIVINEIDATLVSRQPGGPLALAYTTFSTGVGTGYKYYIYNIETGESQYFARIDDNTGELFSTWHPQGDRLFYYYPPPPNTAPVWYQIDTRDDTHRLLGDFISGTWSTEGRYVAYRTNRRTQPIAVYDSESGLTRTYCIPETGARLYEGDFNWSPDSRYLALQAPLPRDENEPGVGQHTLILDIETGEMIDLTTGVGDLVVWMQDPGTYSEEE